MRKRGKQIVCILLAFALLLGDAVHGELPVRAAQTGSGLYQWHRAMSVEDLRKYTVDRNTTDYQGKWVPIIIVAEYSDGTQYYINRKTRLAKRSGEYEYIPHMNRVSESDSVGLVLTNAMKSGEDFVTRGDLGAMHMYYHGEVTQYYGSNYARAEAWSLTAEAVKDYSNNSVDTVYGIRGNASYYAMDQNKVESQGGKGYLPQTYCPASGHTDKKYHFKQAWTFLEDRRSGYFLISNLFTNWISYTNLNGVYALTWGAALDGNSRYDPPRLKTRDMIETPSRAAGYVYGDDGNVIQNRVSKETVQGTSDTQNSDTQKSDTQKSVRDKILEQYDYKYDDPATRVWFKIYIGEEIPGNLTVPGSTLKGQTKVLGVGSTIPAGTTIKVEKDATLIIPEDAFVFLDGTIDNKGTVIVEKGAVVSSALDTDTGDISQQTGQIVCQDGGQLLVMEDAHIYLACGLILKNNGVAVNKGTIVAGRTFTLEDSQIQMADQGRLAIGFRFGKPSSLYQVNFGAAFDMKFRDNVGVASFSYTPQKCNYSVRNGNSKIILEKTSAVDISFYSWQFDENRSVPFSDLLVGMSSGEEQTALSPQEMMGARAGGNTSWYWSLETIEGITALRESWYLHYYEYKY